MVAGQWRGCVQVYLLRSTMPFRYVWVSDAAGESATLLFYIMTGLYFRPHAQNPYFAVNDDDIDLQVCRAVLQSCCCSCHCRTPASDTYCACAMCNG